MLVRPGNAPVELRARDGTLVNQGPGSVTYGDDRGVSDGTLTAGQQLPFRGSVWVQGGPATIDVKEGRVPDVIEDTGSGGGGGAWVQMTQAAYDALGTKDPDTLYVIVG